MIEVEKKVHLDPIQLKKIQLKATFLHSKQIEDTYYDTDDFRYTLENIWIRKRNRSFEVKAAVVKESGLIDRYDEIVQEELIIRKLGLKNTSSLPSLLEENGILPFCTFTTLRQKYQYKEFAIDLDRANFGALQYDVAEIELVVTSEEEIPIAENKINSLLQEFGLNSDKQVLAKLSYFLSKERPDHFNALKNAKVIRSY